MGVMVDGVEIEIQPGQVWESKNSRKWKIVEIEIGRANVYTVIAEGEDGLKAAFTGHGELWKLEPSDDDLVRLLSGPGSEALIQPAEKCVYCERPLETQIVTICPTVDCEYNRGDQPFPTQPEVTNKLRGIIKGLVECMTKWGSWEDGIPEEFSEAFHSARAALGQVSDEVKSDLVWMTREECARYDQQRVLDLEAQLSQAQARADEAVRKLAEYDLLVAKSDEIGRLQHALSQAQEREEAAFQAGYSAGYNDAATDFCEGGE